MIVGQGEVLHVVTRQRFEGDLRRHFVGIVQAATETLIRARGYGFVFDPWANAYVKQPELRERIIPLADGDMILTVLPQSVDLESLQYRMSPEAQLMLSDGNGFNLDVKEFGVRR